MMNIWMRWGVVMWLMGGSGVSWGALHQVPQDHATIQAAIDAAVEGDTILVSPGRYRETIDFGGKNIVLSSTDPDDPAIVAATVIDADGRGRAVTFATGETRAAVLRGFTLTGGIGQADPEGDQEFYVGGGILCVQAGPTIEHNIIEDNRIPTEVPVPGGRRGAGTIEVTGIGGGIMAVQAQALIRHNVLRHNVATVGAGIYSSQSQNEIIGNRFYGNQAMHGGGLVVEFDQSPVIGNLCYDNHAQGIGGGMAIVGAATVANNTVVANSAQDLGGNLFVQTDLTEGFGPVLLTNNIVANALRNYGLAFIGAHPYDVVSYNNIWGNVPGNVFGLADPVGRQGNISLDPRFIDAGGRDFRLSLDSPCIDAGGEVTVSVPASDLDGGPRVVAEAIDLGAHEFPTPRLIARAGDHQYLSRPQTVQLDAGASSFADPSGPRHYQWSQTAGPPVSLSDPDSAMPTFDAAVEGEYRFALTVSDGHLTSGSSETWVTLMNHAPVARVIAKVSSAEVGVPMILEGGRSSDRDGDPLSFYWSQIEGPLVDLFDGDGSRPSFVAEQAGAYRFSLVVNDGLLDSEPAFVTAIVGNRLPVARPGPTRYVAGPEVMLDGRRSHDPDGLLAVDLSYHWRQVSGSTLEIDDPRSATPTLSGIEAGDAIQRCRFELIVSDLKDESLPAELELVIVEDFGSQRLTLLNGPFDPAKPTIIPFEGGNCATGGGWNRFDNTIWSEHANILTAGYSLPHYKYAEHLMTYLSEVAPEYDQPIQTMGFSTGGMIATDIALRLNTVYGDPRYAVNRISYLDAGCMGVYDYPESIERLHNENLTGEPFWIDHYFSNASYFRDTLAVRFPVPPADHGTPPSWMSQSQNPGWWPDGDLFNGGVYGGYYASLSGPAKNLRLPDDVSSYLFEWVPGGQQHLIPFDEGQFPGRLPEAVTLLEPMAAADGQGVILGSLESRNAAGYRVLLGADPQAVDTYQVLLDSTEPPAVAVDALPFDPAYWTVQVRDSQGATLHADPRPLSRVGLSWPVENLRSGQRTVSIQAAIDVAQPGDEIVIQPGVYHENLSLGQKDLTIRSLDPQDPALVERTVIVSLHGMRQPVLDIQGAAVVRLAGLSLLGGSHGIRCVSGDLTLETCLLVGNDHGMAIENGSATLSRCLIADNQRVGLTVTAEGRQRGRVTRLADCVVANNGGYGIEMVQGPLEMDQCRVVENRLAGVWAETASLSRCLIYYNGSEASGPQLEGTGIAALECNIQGGWPGVGNLDADPGIGCLRRDCPSPIYDGGRVVLPEDYRK